MNEPITNSAGLSNTETSDKLLRARVKLLGQLLGKVLQSQAGDAVYKAVETLRTGFIDLHKKENLKKRARLMAYIESLDPDTLSQVVRGFNTYFSLVNIAEEASQHMERRRQLKLGDQLWRGSFDSALNDFIQLGMSADQVQQLFNKLAYIPVITAHPTEAKRRSILYAQRRIFETNEKLNDSRLSRSQRQGVIDELETQIQILWRTDEVRESRPQVRDEEAAQRGLVHGEMAALGSVIVCWATGDTNPITDWLRACGVRYRPRDIGLDRDELRKALEIAPGFMTTRNLNTVLAREPIVDDRFEELWHMLER